MIPALIYGTYHLLPKKETKIISAPKTMPATSTQTQTISIAQVSAPEKNQTERELNKSGLTLNGATPINVR